MAIKPSNDMFKVSEHLGELMAARGVTVEEVQTQFGETPAARCAQLAVIGADESIEVLHDVLIFGRAIVRVLAGASGSEWLVGRWGQGEAKRGQSAPWLVVEVDEQTMDAIEAALSSVPAPPDSASF